MADTDKRILTGEQEQLASEFVSNYGIERSQISFENDRPNPIFDYNALTILAGIFCNFEIKIGLPQHTDFGVQILASVQLPNNKPLEFPETAYLDEKLPDGTTVADRRTLDTLVRSRALRTAIRTGGVDLVKAHRNLIAGNPPQTIAQVVSVEDIMRREIHALAGELGYIKIEKVDGKNREDRTEYEKLIGEQFEGCTSSKDLAQHELRQLRDLLRAEKRGADKLRNGGFSTSFQKAA